MLLIVVTLVYFYYLVWIALTPFLESDSEILRWFPEKEWAVKVPVILLILGFTVVMSFVSIKMINYRRVTA